MVLDSSGKLFGTSETENKSVNLLLFSRWFKILLRSLFFSSYDQAFVIVFEFVTVGDEFALELRSNGSVMRIQQWIAENRDEFHEFVLNC